MSTIHASNFGDGTNTVESGYVLNGSFKAWISLLANSGTPSISDSLNISSITDNQTGSTENNVTNSMSATTYGVLIGPGLNGTSDFTSQSTTCWNNALVGSWRVNMAGATGGDDDRDYGSSLLGDLA